MLTPDIAAFGNILLFLGAAVFFVVAGLVTAWIIRPHRPNVEKNKAYECGEEAVGTAWGQFNVRFYVVALIFLLFDVELVCLFPWAVIFGNETLIQETQGRWGWFALLEALIFVGILALGLAYAWVKGFLDWIAPQPQPSDFESKIPASAYQALNERQYAPRPKTAAAQTS
ncbi:NADH-quinone oxidoreductase subunit A [Eisenibacter elegans]|uniref:NADH-quinone oxidoreductase subunit A n=1 Tax=Eisenibacter elegans TaxID=997 RepID=UPI000410755F|nr:NADH-quinone oxidoreductase subunit A [Eisenibacter elegans]